MSQQFINMTAKLHAAIDSIADKDIESGRYFSIGSNVLKIDSDEFHIDCERRLPAVTIQNQTATRNAGDVYWQISIQQAVPKEGKKRSSKKGSRTSSGGLGLTYGVVLVHKSIMDNAISGPTFKAALKQSCRNANEGRREDHKWINNVPTVLILANHTWIDEDDQTTGV